MFAVPLISREQNIAWACWSVLVIEMLENGIEVFSNVRQALLVEELNYRDETGFTAVLYSTPPFGMSVHAAWQFDRA